MHTFHDAKSGAAITVKVTPRAKKTEVVGFMEDGTIKVRVAAAPEEGRANQALIEYLASVLAIPASQIDIMGGMVSERKLISLIGISPAEVEDKMRALVKATAKPKAAGKPAKKSARKKPGRKKG